MSQESQSRVVMLSVIVEHPVESWAILQGGELGSSSQQFCVYWSLWWGFYILQFLEWYVKHVSTVTRETNIHINGNIHLVYLTSLSTRDKADYFPV